MANKIIKMCITLENMLCVYRNILGTRRSRIIACIRCVMEFVIIFYCIHLFWYALPLKDCRSQLIYYFLNLGNSFVIIISAPCKSKEFSYLVSFIEKNNSLLETDVIYQDNIKIKFRRVIFTVFLVVIFPCLIAYAQYIDLKFGNPHVYVVHTVGAAICDIRYILEYVVLYTFLFTISELIYSITRKLDKQANLVTSVNVNENVMYEVDYAQNLEECKSLYRNIQECLNLVHMIFSFLFTVMLATVTVYFVVVVYEITFEGVKMRVSVPFILITCMRFLFFFVPLYKVSRIAQTAQNSVDILRRQIAHQLIALPLDDKNIKATRKFLHLVHPLKIQASGSINIDMALIPKIIMFFTTYAVTALQFNNVI